MVNSWTLSSRLPARAGCALRSDIPFQEPIGSVRVGRVEGDFVLNPSYTELELSDLNIVMAGTYDAVVMIEGEAKEVSEQVLTDAVTYAHTHIRGPQ